MANDTNMGMSPITGPNTGLAVAPGWPKPVGIISLGWAAFGLACGLMGVGWYFAQSAVMAGAEQQMGPTPDVMKMPATQMIGAAVGSMWALVLLAAGLATLRRNAAGRPLHIMYAIGGILLTIVSAYFGWTAQQAQMEWAAANASDPWAKQAMQGKGIGLAVLGFFTVVGLAWPTFCLVWFGLMGKRPETGRELLPQVI
jgi:hypothetical protein